MADERIFIKPSVENFVTVAMLSMVAFFGVVMARQVVRGIRRVTGDGVNRDTVDRDGDGKDDGDGRDEVQ